MNRLFLAVMVVVILFATVPSEAQAGLSCPPMWGKFNETTLDFSILSVLDTTVSGYVTDYRNTVTFGPLYLGTATIKHLQLSYQLHNTNGMRATFYFTQITPLLGHAVVTECNTIRAPGRFGIRIG